MREKGCLLCVSRTPKNALMWAHYADKHQGIVIGIDFDRIYGEGCEVPDFSMHRVNYTKRRPRENVLIDPLSDPRWNKVFSKNLCIKLMLWKYEQEFRQVFAHESLIWLQKNDLAIYKNSYTEMDSWFLKINPFSIKEVFFGLTTSANLKSKIKELVSAANFKHIKLFQMTELNDIFGWRLIPAEIKS